MGICDDEVIKGLRSTLKQKNIDKLDLDQTVIICSRCHACDKVNEECLAQLTGKITEFTANDTDNTGHPIRQADMNRIGMFRERLPDIFKVKLGARVIPRRNISVESGWVNGTIANVASVYPSCIVIKRLSDGKLLPVPRVRQRLDLKGAAYYILRTQFPLQLGFAVTVHRVQGMTVNKAVIDLNSNFFESGQAYVALSRVRKLEDLTLWCFSHQAISLSSFYKQLLKWCDCVDAIRETPLSTIVPFPNRSDNMSNAPLPQSKKDSSYFPNDKMLVKSSTSTKLGKHTRDDSSEDCISKRPKIDIPMERLLIPMVHMTSIELKEQYIFQHAGELEAKVFEINNQNVPFETSNPPCSDTDSLASNQCHPLLLHIFKPVKTTGDGNCLFNALSITLCGSESMSRLLRVLCAYGLYKYKQVILEAFRHAYPNRDPIQYYITAFNESIPLGAWGSDHHLLALSFLLNRPILQYNTFYHSFNGVQYLTLQNIHTINELAAAFAIYHPDVRTHIVYCTQEHYDILVSGTVQGLPYLPLALFNINNVHWVAMLLQSMDIISNIPIPRTRIF